MIKQKIAKRNPVEDEYHEKMADLFDKFVDALKRELGKDSVTEGTMKIACDFFKGQKFDYRDAQKGVSYDAAVLDKAKLPFTKESA